MPYQPVTIETLSSAFGKVNQGFSDAVIERMVGAPIGASATITYRTASELPATITQSLGADWIRETLSYDDVGLLVARMFQKSTDSGSTWTTIGTLTLAYDGSNRMTNATWS